MPAEMTCHRRLNSGTPQWSYRQLLRSMLAAALPSSRFLVRGPRSSQTVYLTFDDGPHPEYTPRLLDMLREHDVKATFFVLGKQIDAYPDILKDIAADGHAIGHHTYHHAEPEDTTARQIMDEITETDQLILKLTGAPSRLFRPPHGRLSVGKLWKLLRSDYKTVLWNADPKDYQCNSAAELREWFLANPFEGGDIVLLHDVHPFALEALPVVIGDVRTRGLAFDRIQ